MEPKTAYRILRIKRPPPNKRPPPFLESTCANLGYKKWQGKRIFCHFFHLLPKYQWETSFIQEKIGNKPQNELLIS